MKLPFNFSGKARVEALQKENGSRGELYLYGVISDEKWFESDITPKDVKAELDKLSTVKKIDMYVNSPGGSVIAGTAIYNMIKRDTATITAHVDALAGSIASVIVQAADEIRIPKNAFMFIHNPSMIAAGTEKDFQAVLDDLKKFKSTLMGMYSRFKGKAEDLSKMMDDETLMTGAEAVAAGFADVMDDEMAMAASMTGTVLNIGGNLIDTSIYKQLPLAKILGAINHPKPQEDKPAPAAPEKVNSLDQQERVFFDTQMKINQTLF